MKLHVTLALILMSVPSYCAYGQKDPGEEKGAAQEHQSQAGPRLWKDPTRFQLSRSIVGVPDVAISITREVCVLVMRSVKLTEALY